MKVIYEGVDIYDKISVSSCWYDSYSGGHADELRLTLNDTRKLWDRWGPKRGESIAVELSSIKTGAMYIDTVKHLNGVYEIRAYSTPSSMREKHSKSWEEVKLLQLLREIAERNGLSLSTYGVEQRQYSYVEQRNQSDLEFLKERTALELLSFIVYDSKLIVFSEPFMESVEPVDTLKISTVHDFEFKDRTDQKYGRAQITNSGITGDFEAGTGPSLILTVPVVFSDWSEADRFAKGLLRNRNKNKQLLTIWTNSLLKGYSAGSTIGIECESASSWDGPMFVHHVRFDLKKETTKITLRKPLEGY